MKGRWTGSKADFLPDPFQQDPGRDENRYQIAVLVVSEGGLEPPRPYGHQLLKLARLPIPPLRRGFRPNPERRPIYRSLYRAPQGRQDLMAARRGGPERLS